MMTDPIADMLTRIRNALQAGHTDVAMPSSKLKEGLAGILAAEGYIEGYGVAAQGPGREMTIQLKYGSRQESTIQGLRRISSPGRRVYRGASELPRAQGGLGVVVVSTSQGLLADREARRRRLGGEIVCEVW